MKNAKYRANLPKALAIICATTMSASTLAACSQPNHSSSPQSAPATTTQSESKHSDASTSDERKASEKEAPKPETKKSSGNAVPTREKMNEVAAAPSTPPVLTSTPASPTTITHYFAGGGAQFNGAPLTQDTKPSTATKPRPMSGTTTGAKPGNKPTQNSSSGHKPATSTSTHKQPEAGTATKQPVVLSHDFLFTPDQLAAFQKDTKVRDQLLQYCEKNSDYKASPQTVMSQPNHYDANGVNSSSNATNTFTPDARMSYRFGLCYLQTGDTKWAKKAQDIFDAWANTLENVASKQAENTINFNAEYMLAAATWTQKANNWDHRAFDRMTREKFVPAAALDNHNNHGLWGTYLITAAGTYLQDKDLLELSRSEWVKHVKWDINADGIMENEIMRSDNSNYTGGPRKGIKGIAYSHYAALPTVISGKLLNDAGLSVWHTDAGERLDKAAVIIAGWVENPETFPYYKTNPGLYEVTNFSYFPILYSVYHQPELLRVIETKKVTTDLFLLADLFRTSLPEMTVSPTPYPKPRPMTKEEAAENKADMQRQAAEKKAQEAAAKKAKEDAAKQVKEAAVERTPEAAITAPAADGRPSTPEANKAEPNTADTASAAEVNPNSLPASTTRTESASTSDQGEARVETPQRNAVSATEESPVAAPTSAQ